MSGFRNRRSFQIDLLSNASMTVFKGNTLADFSNFFPEQINLEGIWEVALTEISFPGKFNNVTDGKFAYVETAGVDLSIGEMSMRPGLYLSLDELLEEMQHAAQKKYDKKSITLEWTVEKHTQNVLITLPKDSSRLNIRSKDLAALLGYDGLVLIMGRGPHKGTFPMDILGAHELNVYVDLIEHGIIGDVKAPILRSFPLQTKMKSTDKSDSLSVNIDRLMQFRQFPQLQYKRVMKNSFQSIHVTLRDQRGRIVPFVSTGVTRLTLQFQKVGTVRSAHGVATTGGGGATGDNLIQF